MLIKELLTLRESNTPFKVKPGTALYHTTANKFSEFKDRPTWFTPTLSQAQGYHQNTGDSAITLKCEWVTGKVASPKEAMPFVLQVWDDFDLDEPMYSMFDTEIGEWEIPDIKKFISLLTDAGFAGAIHPDYSSLNSDDDSYTLVVFHPNKSIKIVSASTEI